eukprot:Protomagalhaensia_sp_Gyna_25__3673@NODE_32_length_7245_cov_75_898973_g22_i0_p1_GENE_NODE_32_length_7245_cov_75_898973_g22_i0NODE_32_length_7245_cov_75_898973_g22_i0_p1_ORF_typecomplete_len539_score58_84Ank_2/PF12796_7/7_9e12Ank_2/PF12796_7/2_1e07Ank_2/PF12796_7/3_6e09Ank_2/PF12796_7/3_7e13Ank_2/PF12796_7/3_3e10Ank_2/PF12796_7/4_1e06Ank_2/PF12796_7/3_7e06Ank_5/PF13857_6/0_0027Ank_5/PF13857_6/5_9e05Ank_5/PF13857_6/2_2e05Ank_5/PF13857_6/4_9e02Ank_5/PF13857_6/6_3e05Ank_5/PF13857_6/0_00035Ank_5/PF138
MPLRLVEDDELILALRQSRLDVAKKLLLQDRDVDVIDSSGTTPLLLAAALLDFDVVCMILYQSLEPVNVKDKLSETALFKAVSRNGAQIARVLIEAGAEVDTICGYCGDTALIAATRIQSIACVEVLLRAGANVEHVNARHETALSLAALPPSPEEDLIWDTRIFRALLSAGATIRATLARSLAEQGRTEALLLLQAFGRLHFDQPLTERREPALILAALHGQRGLVAALLMGGADPFVRDAQGNDALLAACQAAVVQEAVVRQLLDAGISPNTRDAEHRTPLMHLCCRRSAPGETERALTSLVERGADVFAQDAQGRHALSYASAAGNASLVRFLLHQGAPLHRPDRLGRTPLLAALLAPGHAVNPAAAALLAGGANVCVADHGGTTPLLAAVIRQAALVPVLLERGADVEVRTSTEGLTPLMLATRRRDAAGPTTVLYLLRWGAEGGAVDRHGRSAAQHALMAGAARSLVSFVELVRHQLAALNVEVWRCCHAALALPDALPGTASILSLTQETNKEQARSSRRRRARRSKPSLSH